jgi:3-mercaptopyruvate sulfurtransferase SseA
MSFVAAALLAAIGTEAFAKGVYPSRTIKIVVPLPPGPVADMLPRVVAQKRTDDGTFRSAGEMLQVLQDRGIPPEIEVVTYCTIGNRASQAWFALRYLLGYHDVRVYYGSWAEWGKVADTPIET